MKKIKIVAVFLAILVALSVAICACGNNGSGKDNETTAGGNANNGTTEGPEETTLGGYVESEAITMVEITIEE